MDKKERYYGTFVRGNTTYEIKDLGNNGDHQFFLFCANKDYVAGVSDYSSFEKNYATSFKEAMSIIKEKGRENTQYQSRSA